MSLKQPAWHVIVLSIATFKLYFIYWCYKNWRDLSAHNVPQQTNKPPSGFIESLSPQHLSSFQDVSPMLRTLGVLIPYVNNYLYLTLALGIARLLPDASSWPSKHPLAAACFIVGASIAFDLLAFLGGAWYLLSFISVIPLAIVQHWLNKYWDAREPKGLLTRHGFTAWEIGAIVTGSVLLGFIAVGFALNLKR
ncbi:MAG: hypothetical protein K2W82_10275 [Candidatus Obscuribacterales bacterium]|nr:hypothetical protein [Candidatus Obscuribacterales bacterium]